MILVVAQLPNEENASDGMVQRIAAIDRLIERHERVYLTPRLDPLRIDRFELRDIRPGVRVGSPNLYDRVHLRRMMELAAQATTVIVHSLHWAKMVLPLYAAGNVITDLHGAVPEEQELLGQASAAELFARLEPHVIEHSLGLLAVSDAMAAHLREKYPRLSPRVITLPIVTRSPGGPDTRAERAPWRFLYSGGLQKWQRVPRMLQALARCEARWEAELLTAEVAAAQVAVENAGLRGRVVVRHGNAQEVEQAYLRAHYAFVLREDHVINRVACPTKVQEAFAYGAIPIVESERIGDFVSLGYRFVRLEDFEAGLLPSPDERSMMAAANREVLRRMADRADMGARELLELIASSQPAAVADDVGSLYAEVLLERLEATRNRFGSGWTRAALDLVRGLRQRYRGA